MRLRRDECHMRAHMVNVMEQLDFKRHLRRILHSPERVIVLIVIFGFMMNVQQAQDTDTVLRSNPLAFKGIRILTIAIAQLLALSTIVRRKLSYGLCVETAVFPLALCLCSCALSIPFSSYPLLSMFKTCEIGLVVLICLIGVSSAASKPADLFNLTIKFVLVYNVIIWVECILFPNLAWVKIEGDTPLFGYALSGVFPVINGNTVGLFGSVLFLSYLPRLLATDGPRLAYLLVCVIGLASVVCSYSRISLLGTAMTAMCILLLLRKYKLAVLITLCVVLVGMDENVRSTSMDHFARGKEDRSLDDLSSNRLEMWDYVLAEYGASLAGRGYAAGFRFDKHFSTGHAHNSFFELYFNVGMLGIAAWLLMIGTVFYHLCRFMRARTETDYQFVSVIAVMVFLSFKAVASTVFVYLDMSMIILASTIVYVVKRQMEDEEAPCSTMMLPTPTDMEIAT